MVVQVIRAWDHTSTWYAPNALCQGLQCLVLPRKPQLYTEPCATYETVHVPLLGRGEHAVMSDPTSQAQIQTPLELATITLVSYTGILQARSLRRLRDYILINI